MAEGQGVVEGLKGPDGWHPSQALNVWSGKEEHIFSRYSKVFVRVTSKIIQLSLPSILSPNPLHTDSSLPATFTANTICLLPADSFLFR